METHTGSTAQQLKGSHFLLAGAADVGDRCPCQDFVLTPRLVVPWLRRLVAGFQPASSHVECVLDKAALEKVFSVYFGFPFK
jgi:hypothetical protein